MLTTRPTTTTALDSFSLISLSGFYSSGKVCYGLIHPQKRVIFCKFEALSKWCHFQTRSPPATSWVVQLNTVSWKGTPTLHEGQKTYTLPVWPDWVIFKSSQQLIFLQVYLVQIFGDFFTFTPPPKYLVIFGLFLKTYFWGKSIFGQLLEKIWQLLLQHMVPQHSSLIINMYA